MTLTTMNQPYLTVLGGFFAVVACMQLWEALLWRSKRCDAWNARISDIGAINNHFEPVSLWLMCIALLKPQLGSGLMTTVHAMVAVYILVFGYMTVRFVRQPIEQRCTLPGPGGLVWKWNDFGRRYEYVYFLATMMAVVYAYVPMEHANVIAGLFAGSFILSYQMYKNTGVVGGIWCWFAALMPWIFVIRG
jgi:hypothetical protein